MNTAETVAFLKERAESYWRDAMKMDADEDLKTMAVAYRAIARELRDCAKEMHDAR